MKKVFLLVLAVLTLNIANVYAEAYYTNNSGVEMNETQYNKMLRLYSEKVVENMDRETFENSKDLNILETEVLYEKTTYEDNDIVSKEYLTEAEYYESIENEENSISPMTTVYHGTTYKKLSLSLSEASNYYVMICDLDWNRMPNTRSFDVFAFMLQNFTYSGVTASQYYFTNSGHNLISYNSSSAGYKSFSNGAGFSMNLVDGSDIVDYDMIMTAKLYKTSGYTQGHVFLSYQHAQRDVTRAESKSYTLSGVGLGGVIYYSNTSIRGAYDAMDGVHINYIF